jgi:4a-hydroxytetrahydrobiopterin dehydratase
MEKMTQDQIDAALAKLPQWSQVGEAIQRTFDFADFITAMKFVDKVAVAAEQVQHHPDMLIRYKKVTLTYATHDANGITQKDFDAALHADQVANVIAPPKPKPAPKPARTGAGRSGQSRAGMRPPKA